MIDEKKKSDKLPAPSLLNFSSKPDQFNSRLKSLETERHEFLEEWRDICDYTRSKMGARLMSGNRKKRRSKKVLNEVPIFASRTLGAGMMAGVASPARPWFKMSSGSTDGNMPHAQKVYMDAVQRMMYRIIAGSNYYSSRHRSFRDMGDFGQGPMFIEKDYYDVINCYVSPPGEYYLATNKRNRVDTCYRDFSMTVMQIVSRWGKNSPREVLECYDRGDYDSKYDVVHVCEPNFKQIKGVPGPIGMPYLNVYYCKACSDLEGNSVLQTSGYQGLPFSAARWSIDDESAYGDGCGSLALPISKSLQESERREGQVVDRLAAPPVQAPASMKKETISHRPGAASYYPDKGGPTGGPSGAISPLYQINPGSLQAIGMTKQSYEQRVNRAYFADLFLMLSQSSGPQMTAREVQEHHEEKLIALGPTLDITHTEGLDVELMRIYDIAKSSGILPPPPPDMDPEDIKVEYTSILAVAQRAIGVSQIERFAGFMGNMAAGDPATMDKWDRDQTIDEYHNALGPPASIIKSDEEVAKIREGRKKQEEQAAAMQQVEQGANAAKVLSEADTSRDSNLLADILGGSVNGGSG